MTAIQRRLPQALPWVLPASTTHEGIPLGNGLFGALIWGQSDSLRFTINRADYWDHQGGITFGPDATYNRLREWLAQGDEGSVRREFEGLGPHGERHLRPTRLPMGRIDITLEQGTTLATASLDPATGEARLLLDGTSRGRISALVPRGRALLAVHFDGVAESGLQVRSRPPDADAVVEAYAERGIPAAAVSDSACDGGWYQRLPNDPDLYVVWALVSTGGMSTTLYVAAEYGETREEAKARATESLRWAQTTGFDALAEKETSWWRRYWRQCPAVDIPDPVLQEAYDLGMYKYAGIAAPDAPPATLQGPWVEEYRMPPWSSDYHFNINVQECYWPAYAGNQLGTMPPLFDMLEDWLPHLRDIARSFVGTEDGIMLHHSVDDRGTCMGGFWTGAIDHGSTGWMAHMMWQYYLYTQDKTFLAERAYPFMKAAMRVYEAMLETTPDGALVLPVSVSPEYGGSAMDAWGANASFQLAIIHALCRALIRAVEVLALDVDTSGWERIDRDLPAGSIAGEGSARELSLWDGQPLAHSHRHHSHLAGLYPFDTLNYWGTPEDQTLVDNSVRTWTRIGMGEWSGWCVPWAAILQARMHNGERAALLLEEHQRVFVTPGRATTHDAVFPGFTSLAMRSDIMQIEAAMGAATAVMEMLLHTASDVMYVFPAIPAKWANARFEGIRAEGAFLVSAERRAGRTVWVRVLSEQGGTLHLANPFGAQDVLQRSSEGKGERRLDGQDMLTINLAEGEEIVLYPAPEVQ